jgi:hypothetical protein
VNRISAIVCFGVSESQVDRLIEATMGTNLEPARWVVFGVDMTLLGMLDRQWGKAIDLVLALLPGTSEKLQAAALTILEHEGVLPAQSVWVRGPDVPASAPQRMLAAFDAKGSGVSDLVVALGSFVDGRGPMHRGPPGNQSCE